MDSGVARVVWVTVAALAALGLGFLGLGVSLMAGPFGSDADVRTGGWFFLTVAATLVVSTVLMLRGSFAAWLTNCIGSALIVLVPVGLWVSATVEQLGQVQEPTNVMTTTSYSVAVMTYEQPLTVAMAIGDTSGYLVVVAAAWAAVMLLLPATRQALTRRRPG